MLNDNTQPTNEQIIYFLKQSRLNTLPADIFAMLLDVQTVWDCLVGLTSDMKKKVMNTELMQRN